MPKTDPTRTKTLRRIFEAEMRRRFNKVKRLIRSLVEVEDVFGIQADKKAELTRLNVTEVENHALVYSNASGPATRRYGVGGMRDNVLPAGTIAEHRQPEGTHQQAGPTERGTRSGSFEATTEQAANHARVDNTRWRFQSDPEKVESFRQWLDVQMDRDIVQLSKAEQDKWWNQYIRKGYEKGAGRAFDDVRKPIFQGSLEGASFFEGSKREFLFQSFAHPVSIERVRLVAGRTFNDLKGVTNHMSTQITRTLTDGLIAGDSPRKVARDMTKVVDKITKTRAVTIARTETIRAHAEGQLDSLERLGVDKIGVAVEWSTTGDGRVCPLCQPMESVVMSVKESRNLIPRHPNCRCAFIPANVGEDPKGQKRSQTAVEDARDKSVRAEIPKKAKSRTTAQQKQRSQWAGSQKKIAKSRPKSILDEATPKAPKKLKKSTNPQPTKKGKRPSSPKAPKAPKVSKAATKSAAKATEGAIPKEIRENWTVAERADFEALVKERFELNKLRKAGEETAEHIARQAEIKTSLADLRNIAKARAKARAGGVVAEPVGTTTVAVPDVINPPEFKMPNVITNNNIEEVLEKHPVLNAELEKVLALDTKIDKEVFEMHLEQEKLLAEMQAKHKERIMFRETYKQHNLELDKYYFDHRHELDEQIQVMNDQALKMAKKQKALRNSRAKKGRKALQLPKAEQSDVRMYPVDYNNSWTKAYKKKLDDAGKFVNESVKKRPHASREPTFEVRQLDKGKRAFSREGVGVSLAPGDEIGTFVHEIGHQIEDQLGPTQRRANDFIEMRIKKAGTPDEKLIEVFPYSNYDDHEVGNLDGFREAFGNNGYYVGKRYARGSTEVISMGLEEMYNNPTAFASADPEYFKFLLAIMRDIL